MSRFTNTLLVVMCVLLCLNLWVQLQGPALAQRELPDVINIRLVDSLGRVVGSTNPLPVKIAGSDPVPIDLNQVGGSRLWSSDGLPITVEGVNPNIVVRTRPQQ